MTPFEAAGYTKDTVFRVCTHDEDFDLGTLVRAVAKQRATRTVVLFKLD